MEKKLIDTLDIPADVIGLLGDSGQKRVRKVLWGIYKKNGIHRLINEATVTIQSLANDKYKLIKNRK